MPAGFRAHPGDYGIIHKCLTTVLRIVKWPGSGSSVRHPAENRSAKMTTTVTTGAAPSPKLWPPKSRTPFPLHSTGGDGPRGLGPHAVEGQGRTFRSLREEQQVAPQTDARGAGTDVGVRLCRQTSRHPPSSHSDSEASRVQDASLPAPDGPDPGRRLGIQNTIS